MKIAPITGALSKPSHSLQSCGVGALIMWDEIKKKIISRADWIFCILLAGFILSFFSDSEGSQDLRAIYFVGSGAIGLYCLLRWIMGKISRENIDVSAPSPVTTGVSHGVRRNPWIAGLLSLLAVGLGQIYNGQFKKAVLFLFIFVLGYPVWLFVVTSLPAPLNIGVGILVIVLTRLYFVIDAIITARGLGEIFRMTAYNRWYVYLAYPALVFLAVLVSRSALVQAYRIPSATMFPTLQIGDNISVNKLAYGIRVPFLERYLIEYKKPQRNDVVVHIFPEDRSKDFIKRVIAVEGDVVEIRDKRIYINNQRVDDPHAHFEGDDALGEALQARDDYGPTRVPENHIFVMGDNRDRSYDSRFWGFLELNDVKGKAAIVYWSRDDTSWVRWGRIGQTIR